MKRKRKALYAKQKNLQNALKFFSSSVCFAEMKTVICVRLTNTGFLLKNFFRFSGWCAWCKMVQLLCPNWCNFFFQFITFVWNLLCKFNDCAIFYTTLFFIFLYCFFLYTHLDLEGKKESYGEGKKSIFHVWNSVTD